MLPELGQLLLAIALVAALTQSILPLVGAAKRDLALMRLANTTAAVQWLSVVLAFACLVASFLASDFSVQNVVNNSNTTTPAIYKFTATWGSHEGSMLLWVLILASWQAAVVLFSAHLTAALKARVLAFLGMIAFGFLVFLLMFSNPFERLLPAALEGRDLNPLLQDPGMIIHPPLLYMGYVGFAVPFAFALAALLEGRLDAGWARWVRPWATAAWSFLTLGIMLGSAWAYYELGWGGWWFWDPVENASFMPWLAGVALIHSLAVTEKRGAFKGWTVLLAITCFSLSLLGTFIVRSGVITSVHAFATDPQRGVFILGFLLLVVGGSLLLYALRAGRFAPGHAFEPVSRESFLLANNVLMVAATATVGIGTLYPLALEAITQDKISVGPPYFEAVFVPLLIPALFLMAVGPVAAWRHATLPSLAMRLQWAGGLALVLTLLLTVLTGKYSAMMVIAFLAGVWVIASSGVHIVQRARGAGSPSASFWGMQLAHIGIGIFVLAAALTKGLESKLETSMAIGGEPVALGGYNFTLQSVSDSKGPNYQIRRGQVLVTQVGEPELTLYPEKRFYPSVKQTMTEAAIDSGFTRDVYVALGEDLGDRRFSVQIYIKPFIDWIWFGCVLMALGGFAAVADRRYRVGQTDSARAAAGKAANAGAAT